jgi:hypothetical protein
MSDQFPIAPDRIVATLAALFDAQGQAHLAEVLKSATPSVEVSGYDNWQGGSTYYSLQLELPVAQYARLEPTLSQAEETITEKIRLALRKTGSDIISQVVITPAFDDSERDQGSIATSDAARHLWDPGMFRLFLSHVAVHKVAVAELKRKLFVYGVSGFVAHEDIEPSLEWQGEIELALRSMDAMAALLTPEFHESNWTDQETGIAIGQGVLVVPVRLPINPYGFLAKTQGLRGELTIRAALASEIVDILLRRPRTADAMREGLVVALESSTSYADSKAVTAKLKVAGSFNDDQVRRLIAAINTNSQVSRSIGVPEALRRIVDAQTPEPPPAEENDLDDLPF